MVREGGVGRMEREGGEVGVVREGGVGRMERGGGGDES